MKVTVYKTLVIVEGAGEFPMDMLRYDSCVPNTERDSHKIRDEAVTTRRVGLRRLSVYKDGATSRRWESFGWHVVWEGEESDNLPPDLHKVVYG